VPLAEIACVLLLKVCFNIVWYDVYLLGSDFSYSLPEFNVIFSMPELLLIIIPFFILVIWSLVRVLLSIKDRNTLVKPSYGQLALAMIIGFIVSFLSIEKGVGALIYSLLPAAFIAALSIEMVDKKQLLTAILTVVALLPFISLTI
jgi:hypothetical protein